MDYEMEVTGQSVDDGLATKCPGYLWWACYNLMLTYDNIHHFYDPLTWPTNGPAGLAPVDTPHQTKS